MVASVVNSSFNSRTLGRVRQEYPQLQLFAIGVSIHAPWEGCDVRPACPSRQRARFNSRTLGRVRHAHTAEAREYSQFQFTHPGKGATTSQSHRLDSVSVSIHAPWEGCDGACVCILVLFVVSIHAPWEGCDHIEGACASTALGFNSRTLGRVRPSKDSL